MKTTHTQTKMNTESTIEAAIARSVSHTEIVKVEVGDIAVALTEVNTLSDEYDHTDANEGEDVWGKTEDGSEFRILLVKKPTVADLADYSPEEEAAAAAQAERRFQARIREDLAN